MHTHSLSDWQHDHVFLGVGHDRNERRTWIVVGVTAVMMVGEIAAGLMFGSMALLADGIHMATHAGALAIAAAAYAFARRHAGDRRFTFGTGKVGELAGFSSALILAVIAVLIGYESALRLTAPTPIRFDESIAIAALGLIVNLLSAWLLHRDEETDAHDHDHDHHYHDHNLRAAYLHVLADALTSVMAILALLAGRFFGWLWMDPIVGLLGAIVIARWAWSLMRVSGAVLVDSMPAGDTARQIQQMLEQDGDRVSDLHLWRVGPGHLAVIVALVSDHPLEPDVYRQKLLQIPHISYVTVELQLCKGKIEAAELKH